jgi:hypothetical protein
VVEPRVGSSQALKYILMWFESKNMFLDER